MVKSYPTPLWYIFNSELDIVAKASVPDVQQILSTHVQERLSSRLGERACDMLTAYIEVKGGTKHLHGELQHLGISGQSEYVDQ